MLIRQPEIRNHFYSKFNLTGSYSLIISRNNTKWGKVYAHNVEVKNNSSANIFFDNIPLKVKASAMPGFRFVRWEVASVSTSSETEIIISGDSYLTAVFEPAELTDPTMVINEINYNSSPLFDIEDWLELYNLSEIDTDISGWKIRDNSTANTFTFPAGSQIPGKDYIVICRDTLKFNTLHLNIENVYGNFDFGLSSEGDMILLFDSESNLIDSIFYETSGEWTSLPNGNGPTLFTGLPARLNDVYTKTEWEEPKRNSDFYLYSNYPNPFNPITSIEYGVGRSEYVTLKVYDVLGREIATLVDEYRPAGSYEVEFDASLLTSGVYFYKIQAGSFNEVRKMVPLR